MEIVCRHCSSNNLKYSKEMNIGPIMGVSLHYVITCLNCKKRYKVKRSKEILEKMPFESWILSKKSKERLAKQNQTPLL